MAQSTKTPLNDASDRSEGLLAQQAPGLVIGLVTPEYLVSDPDLNRLNDCDWVEFRGDLFAGDLGAAYVDFATRCPLPILYTLRLQSDGGRWPNALAVERLEVWRNLATLPARLRPRMLDIEIEAFAAGDLSANLTTELIPVRDAGIQLLTSHHVFKQAYSLAACRELLPRLELPQPDAVKLAMHADSSQDCETLLTFAQEVSQTLRNRAMHKAGSRPSLSAIFAMGSEGQATRLLAPLVGCPLTYGTLSGAALAPGQLPVQKLRQGIQHMRGLLQAYLQSEWSAMPHEVLSQPQLSRLIQDAKSWLGEKQTE